MKISKLFHWLYAVVMLLPIFAIGVTCGYAMFNKNAYQSYSGKTEYEATKNLYLYYATNESSESEESIINNVTHYKVSNYNYAGTIDSINPSNYQVATQLSSTIFNVSNFKLNDTLYEDVNSIVLYSSSSTTTIFLFEENYVFNQMYFSYQSTRGFYKNTEGITIATYKYSFILATSNTYHNNRFNYIHNDNNIYYQVDATNLKNLEKDIFYTDTTVSNVFYYSVDKVQQSPLFNWAENSFLVTPFAYIVSLFSMPTNSPIVFFLSYWLAISIIWLVFDLIMYVPLLVHRWLDKGVLE